MVNRAERLQIYNEILRLSLEDEGSVGISQIEGLTTKNLELTQVQRTIAVIEEHLTEVIGNSQFDSVLSKALSSLGYMFTGLWQVKLDTEELSQCCNGNLIKLLFQLLEVCQLEHQLLVLVVVSNQLLPQYFTPYTESVVGFSCKLLGEVTDPTNSNPNADLIVQQCVATLLNISTQSKEHYRKHIDVKLAYYLVNYLFSKVSLFTAISTTSNAISGSNSVLSVLTPELTQLLRDLMALLYAVPIRVLRFFVAHTLKEYDLLEQAIK
ncbi:hypothetical protein EON65_03280 [archaeon]|nr:MAG: hypothetical protein EON65_03280 [archaeon]